jgi:hypothetical protein
MIQTTCQQVAPAKMVPTMLICQQQQSNKGTRRSIEFSQAEEVQVKQVNPRTRGHFKSKLKKHILLYAPR